MSFVERNKVWLLPLLGLGVVGVVVLNLKTFRGKPTPPAPVQALPAEAPAPPQPPPPAPVPPRPAAGGPSDLWSDLRPLETPAPSLNDLPALLTAAEQPLKATPAPRPQLDPPAWMRLPPVPVFPAPVVRSTAPTALPPLEFILRTPEGRWAYFGGRPFAEGQRPDGHHRIQSIQARRVVLRSPDGGLRSLTTDLSLSSAALPEAP